MVFLFQNNLKNLDPSYKKGGFSFVCMWVGVKKGKPHLIAEFHKTDVDILDHSGNRKTAFYSKKKVLNTVR